MAGKHRTARASGARGMGKRGPGLLPRDVNRPARRRRRHGAAWLVGCWSWSARRQCLDTVCQTRWEGTPCRWGRPAVVRRVGSGALASSVARDGWRRRDVSCRQVRGGVGRIVLRRPVQRLGSVRRVRRPGQRGRDRCVGWTEVAAACVGWDGWGCRMGTSWVVGGSRAGWSGRTDTGAARRPRVAGGQICRAAQDRTAWCVVRPDGGWSAWSRG
jgi:hypothetical protein